MLQGIRRVTSNLVLSFISILIAALCIIYLVYTYVYFQECFCCRENFLRERLVTLTHCYDPDGVRLEDEDGAIMEVRLREPNDCKCYKCGDFSR